MELVCRWVSENSLLLSVNGTLAEAAKASVLIAGRLQHERPAGLLEIVPGAGNVLVLLKPLPRGPEPAAKKVVVCALRALEGISAPARGALHRISVTYGGASGPDVEEVARLCGLSPREVIAYHASAEYVVAFIGFSPGFPYLLGLPEILHVPRLASPRTRVPAGSVAIAGPFAGIYPKESPGGWRLLGRTPVSLFDPNRRPPALLKTGDIVRFEPA
ncbi:MAG: 5-oxoprolinase subunit PxpB [Acidobacteria bacterium]|nr:5-oxoprolinase subunit PxpB [Acidobacteriota bacterium]MCG3194519.1 putative protein YbgJ [Thermoanaerobaculia bacterium]MCK6683719.1 5-oxoprolinase subunit PxpB [Thermoanaerobaculia bacterium]